MTKWISLLITALVISSCSSVPKKADLESPFSGIWKQTGFDCQNGEPNEETLKSQKSLKEGETIQIMRLVGNEAISDIKSKSYSKKGYCRIVTTEKWDVSGNLLTVSDTKNSLYGFGDYDCDKFYSVPGKRTHKIELDGDRLRIYFSKSYEAKTGEWTPACKTGQEVMTFQRLL